MGIFIITDAWVYINDNLQGVYELPAEFPFAKVVENIRIRARIRKMELQQLEQLTLLQVF